MKNNIQAQNEFLSLFEEVRKILPELSVKAKVSKKTVTLLVTPIEFYKKCSDATLEVLDDIRSVLNALPDIPLLEHLEHCLDKIKKLLLAIFFSKKELFLS